MLNKLINIRNISAIQQNLSHNIYGLNEVQFEETPVGKGGVGSVYKVINIDGATINGLLIKLITQPELIETSFETITILHDKINKYQTESKTPIYTEIPELNGLPFLAFKCKIEGAEDVIAGYLMKDLVYYGYEDFGSEKWNNNHYFGEVGFEEKLYLCYQFSRGVNFLHELNFIHSDLKDISTFINLKRPQLSLIDFDGGYNYDKQPFALTMGAITEWASARWRKLIGQGKSVKDVSSKERLEEEHWNLAAALFQILFGFSPFYFLKDLNEETIDSYLDKNSWPNFDQRTEEINPQNKVFHEKLVNMINELSTQGLKSLVDTFVVVFNEGHKRESKRLSAKQWKELLFEINKQLVGPPKIESFNSNKNSINKKDETVKFNWTTTFYRAVYIDEQLQNPLVDYAEVEIADTKDVCIKVVNDFGEATEKVSITAVKIEPSIKHFDSNISKRVDLIPVVLDWKTENCLHVTIDRVGEKHPANGNIEVNPLEKTKYILSAIGFFDQKVDAELEVDVELAKVISFRYEINIEKGIDNIDVFWETENANEVEISPKIGKVDIDGSKHIGILDKTEFTIKAKGHFNTAEKTIEAQPFPIPIIKGLFIPTPIVQIETVIPSDLLKVPDILNSPLNMSFNNSINFNNITPSFVELNKNEDLKTDVQQNEGPKKTLTYLNSLFNIVNKKNSV